MGSTYSSASAAGAFTTKRGNQLVFMWEELCESNVSPQIPRWSLVFVGSPNGAMDRVFRAAASCEGGMLRGARGRDISPEGYINRWLKEFSKPRDMAAQNVDYTFELKMGDGFYDPINLSQLESSSYPKPNAIFDVISVYGLSDVVKRIQDDNEKVELSLYEHGELMIKLHQMGINIWRMMRLSCPVGWGNPNITLQYQTTNAPAPGFPTVVTIADKEFELKDGLYRQNWSVLYDHVKHYAQHEINRPGSYKRYIKGLRDYLKSVPKAAMDMVIDVVPESRDELGERKRIIPLLGESFTVGELLTKGSSLLGCTLWYHAIEIHLERQPLTALIPMCEQLEFAV